ncbi:MAG: (Fe-S)-binding protein [Candidatus Odinarchaeota archaeon]
MESKNEITEQLNRILKEDRVLTDIEDRYVYSFEKIFEKPAYPAPNIVVKVFSLEEEEEISKLAEKEGFLLIKRGKKLTPSLITGARSIIMVDDVKVPELAVIKESIENHSGITETIKNIHRNPLNTRLNRALALKHLFSGKTTYKCHECTTCSDYCTVNASFNGIETWSSRGRALLIRGMMRGEINVSNKIADILYTCTKCGLCFSKCSQDLDLYKAIAATRHLLAEKNMVPQVFHDVAKNITEYGDPSGEQVTRRFSWLKKISSSDRPAKADVLYWVGCTVASRTPRTANAFFNILNSANIDFTMLNEEEGCCGYVLHSAGLLNEAREIARGVLEKVRTTGAKTLVTPCAGCYYTFNTLYPEDLDVSLPFKILHSSQFIEQMMNSGEITLDNPINASVTYHDPCSLGRHAKVYQAPRNVLSAIKGLEITEMPLNRDFSRCCGGGGGLWTFNSQTSMEVAETRLKEDFAKTDVDMLITACPQCQMNIRFASRKKDFPVKISDITEIVEAALTIEKS